MHLLETRLGHVAYSLIGVEFAEGQITTGVASVVCRIDC